MKYIKQNRNYLIDRIVKSGADKESINLLKGIKIITFKDTNTTIVFTQEIGAEPLDKGVV